MKHIGVGIFTPTARSRELLLEAHDSGRISYGPFSRAFEEQFAAIHESAFAVLSNSGTSSIQVALQALKELRGWADGDEVIVPAVTFVATVNAVLHVGLKPVLVDVDPLYYEMDATRIEAAITERTRAIMPVHLFGQPCDMMAIKWIAIEHNLAIVEDSCECMFVANECQMVGSFGEVGCFSTYVAHLLTTGVGGLATTSDPVIAAKMRSLVNHGRDGIYMDIDSGRGARGEHLREIISKRFRFDSVGHSYRITEFEAAIGLAQLETWEKMILKRRSNAAYLTERLKPYTDLKFIQTPAIRPFTGHAFMMYPLVLYYESKEGLTAWLEERGIETREMLPLTNQPVYSSWVNEDDYPVAKWINSNGFYIGCHQALTTEDLDTILAAIHSYFVRETDQC